MNATPLELLMILSLGLLAGCGAGLLIGFLAGRQKQEWMAMSSGDRMINILLVLASSSAAVAALAWYLNR